MIHIYKDKTVIQDQKKLDELKLEFENTHSIVLNDLLSVDLRGFITMELRRANYIKKTHQEKDDYIIGEEYMIEDKNIIANLFFLLMNRNEYLDAIRYVTGIDEIKSFGGRIYKLDASDDCFDSWHDDFKNNEGRLVGMSLNLSEGDYEGGHFLLRTKKTDKIHKEVSYKKWGTAHLFRIDKTLEHKVTKVVSEIPRVAYAGWFRSKMGFKDYLKS
jgi:hypothetical protein